MGRPYFWVDILGRPFFGVDRSELSQPVDVQVDPLGRLRTLENSNTFDWTFHLGIAFRKVNVGSSTDNIFLIRQN